MGFDLSNVTGRPYRGDEDLLALVELVNAATKADGETRLQTDESVKQFLGRSNVELPQLWESGDGQLLMNVSPVVFFIEEEGAEKKLEVRAIANIHPEARNQGLEDQLLDWIVERVRQIGKTQQLSAALSFRILDTWSYWKEALERKNFEIVRFFLTMENHLAQPLPEPIFPSGFTVRDRAGLDDPKAWADLYNQSFIDHYHHHDMSVAEVEYEIKSPNYRPELDLVIVAPDDTWVALCRAEIRSDEKIEGEQVGRIGLLGTRRGYRNQGLGRAAILTGMRLLQKAGSQRIRLLVDASSLTGATRLYEAVGFRNCETILHYSSEPTTPYVNGVLLPAS